MMRRLGRHAVLVGLVVGLLTGCASVSEDHPQRPVRLVKDAGAVARCDYLGPASDNDLDDLKDKARERGGDTVLVTGTHEQFKIPTIFERDISRQIMLAEVYRCE